MSDGTTTTGQLLTIPSWTLPAIVACVVGVGSGYVGGTRTASDPAVLAEGVARLREDVAVLRDVRSDVGALRVEVAELSRASSDGWRRADHDQWVSGTYRRDLARLDDQLERQREALEALRLELRTPKEKTPWNP